MLRDRLDMDTCGSLLLPHRSRLSHYKIVNFRSNRMESVKDVPVALTSGHIEGYPRHLGKAFGKPMSLFHTGSVRLRPYASIFLMPFFYKKRTRISPLKAKRDFWNKLLYNHCSDDSYDLY